MGAYPPLRCGISYTYFGMHETNFKMGAIINIGYNYTKCILTQVESQIHLSQSWDYRSRHETMDTV